MCRKELDSPGRLDFLLMAHLSLLLMSARQAQGLGRPHCRPCPLHLTEASDVWEQTFEGANEGIQGLLLFVTWEERGAGCRREGRGKGIIQLCFGSISNALLRSCLA